MQWITELMGLYSDLLKSNPIVGGLMSLWGLTLLTFLLRSVPASIFGFLKRQFTTTLQFTNDTIGTNLQTYTAFMEWFENSSWSGWSRSLSLSGRYYNSQKEDGTVVGIGNGSHFFFYKGRPFWMERTQIQNQGAYHIQYEIVITALGRNRQVILDLIEEFRYKETHDKISVYQFEDKNWTHVTDIPRRHIKTVVINRDVKQEMLRVIDEFTSSRGWYEQRGLPYKMTYLLHGIPGTGKSSLIKAIASHYGMNLCVLSLTYLSDMSFARALTTVPSNSLVVIEDFDSTDATKARKSLMVPGGAVQQIAVPVQAGGNAVPAPAATETKEKEDTAPRGFLTLSGMLNALDGVVSLDGTLIMLTTNVAHTLDPALVRAGRIDHQVELMKLEDAEIREYVRLMFPSVSLPTEQTFAPILGCDLQKLYFANRHDEERFVRSIPLWLTGVAQIPRLSASRGT